MGNLYTDAFKAESRVLETKECHDEEFEGNSEMKEPWCFLMSSGNIVNMEIYIAKIIGEIKLPGRYLEAPESTKIF